MMTEKQKKVIGYIEKNTGLKFEGKTKKDAMLFISENIEKSKDDLITEKQKKAIENICSILSCSFYTDSKKTAREFISSKVPEIENKIKEKIRVRNFSKSFEFIDSKYYSEFGEVEGMTPFIESVLDLEEEIEYYGEFNPAGNSVFIPNH